MKMFVLRSVMCILVSLSLISSVQGQQRIFVGAASGLNLTKHYGSDTAKREFRHGYIGGIFLESEINDRFSIQPEVLFAMKGSKSVATEIFSSETWMSYLSIPLLLKIKAPVESLLKPYFLAGPVISFSLDGELEFVFDGVQTKVDIKDDLKKVDFGFALGVGAKLKAIDFGIRSEWGLKAVDSEEAAIKNWAVSFLAGYSFEIR